MSGLSETRRGSTKAERETIADLIGRMLAQGSAEGEIARAVGVDTRTVRRHRAKLRGSASVKSGRPVVGRADASVAIPPWCPNWLREDYGRLGQLYGEEIAARECRKLKAEAERFTPAGAR